MRTIRRLLAASLVVGLVGTGTELLLLGHYEGALQYAPLVGIAVGLVSVAWLLTAPSLAAVRTVRLVMLLFVMVGGIGVGLHAKGNQEFELEMYPTRRGWDLQWKTLTGATPVLAPGTMALLGFIGLAHIHRHPAEAGAPADGASGETQS